MSWAEVKKINSDMSTSLDELIKSQRILGASDVVVKVISSTETTLTSAYKNLGGFATNVRGSVRVMIGLRNTSTVTSTDSATVRVLDSNGTVKGTTTVSVTTGASGQKEAIIDIAVLKDASYTIEAKENSGGLNATYVRIGASVVDGSMIS